MSGYTKLFGSILDSTVWKLSLASKVVWVTMMAMADRDGVVEASVPGLADRAGVTIEQCETALAAFLAPDRYSRTKDHDGRRIEEIDGGWRLINHEKYTQKLSAEDRRERDAERQRRHRDKAKERDMSRDAVTAHVSHDTQIQIQTQTQTHPSPRTGARVWAAADWLDAFGKAWSAKLAAGARHYGNTTDAKACSDLAALLEELPQTDLLAAQERAGAMFAEFFAERTRDLVKARHCFAFFVTRWGQLRVPAVPAVAPPKPWAVPEPPRADPNCRDWHAGGKNTGKRHPRGQQPGCPECKSVYLRDWTAETRTSEPTPASEVLRQGGQRP